MHSSSFIVREEQGGIFPRIERDGMRLFRFSTRHKQIQIKEEILIRPSSVKPIDEVI